MRAAGEGGSRRASRVKGVSAIWRTKLRSKDRRCVRRVADTKGTTGTLAGPFLSAGQTRDFPLRSSACNVPSNAQAYSLNFTVVPRDRLNYLAGWPTGQGQPP